jgi:hypothetical protein
MSMRQEFNGFHNIEGWTFGTVKIESFAGRRALGGPRWNCRCVICGSSWIDGHFTITESGSAYRCKNQACGDLHRIKPQPKAIEHEHEHEDKPKALEFKQRVDVDYERYARYCKRVGLQAGSQSDWANLDDRMKDDLLKPIEAQEFGDQLERDAREELRRKYGV